MFSDCRCGLQRQSTMSPGHQLCIGNASDTNNYRTTERDSTAFISFKSSF